MSTSFYFKSIDVRNFRAFKKLELNTMKRINLIGGINGSGKSALLETLFFTMDLNNPISIIRPLQWRGIPATGNDLERLFPSTNLQSEVRTKTSSGAYQIELKYGPPDKDVIMSATQNLDPIARNTLSQLSAPNTQGVSIIAKRRSNVAVEPIKVYVSQNGENFNAAGTGVGSFNMPLAIYISLLNPTTPQEIAERISRLIKQGKKQTLVGYLNLLSPAIKDIAVFQDGSVAQTYVTLADEPFTPLALMGGGLRALTEMVVSAMISANGVVFFDELDSALHFSVVPKLWKTLAEISNSENVQVFATTHSRETISAAAQGMKIANREGDFQFVRIDDLDSHHSAVHYNVEELSDAVELQVEVR
jgi:ABC-type branched-subunit amino acid transport system ATPase component